MKNKLLISLTLNIFVSFSSFSQYQHFLQYVTPYLSSPVVSGFYHINPNNSFQPGYLYQQYRLNTPDLDNQMALLDYHTDSLVGYTHYKYQQLYKNIPIEGAGCIEHFNEFNKLVYINAKLIDSIKQDAKPKIGPDEAIITLIDKLNTSARTSFAWDSPEYETQMQQDMNDSTATWYPDAKLIFAVDTFKNMTMVISGDRYKLAYAIPITFLNPFETIIYHIDANTGDIIKTLNTSFNDGPAIISNYGQKIIDTQWKGGITQGYILKTNDNNRAIHTKKNGAIWNLTGEVNDNDDNWDMNHIRETSVHYLTTAAWDFYKLYFNRSGQDNNNIDIRVHSQWEKNDAKFFPHKNNKYNTLKFGLSDLEGYLGAAPTIVGHEFTHGVIHHTSHLIGENESGAINESFCDIFGVIFQTNMLDQGVIDWTFGNSVALDDLNRRSLSDPKSLGQHKDDFGFLVIGQPDTYLGEFWYPGGYDHGGIHMNSGVINKWFYILTNGESGINDNNDNYNISGIGMSKSMKIVYHTMTSGLLNSSQFTDVRESTIESAIALFGYCSIEHQRTIDAWYAVGIGGLNECQMTLTEENIADGEILIYPNPTSSILYFELPSSENYTVTILDLSGKNVQSFTSKEIYFSRNIESLCNGTYIVQIQNGMQIINKKIYINK
jgi:Zn-dependent metalloprotease